MRTGAKAFPSELRLLQGKLKSPLHRRAAGATSARARRSGFAISHESQGDGAPRSWHGAGSSHACPPLPGLLGGHRATHRLPSASLSRGRGLCPKGFHSIFPAVTGYLGGRKPTRLKLRGEGGNEGLRKS